MTNETLKASNENSSNGAVDDNGTPLPTRRHALIFGMSALAVLLTSSSAYAFINYAFTSTDNAYDPPTIRQLSENSNLFRPGDRPRTDKIATCALVNRDMTDGRSSAYWGTDCGFCYITNAQEDWPYRNHAFGLNYFDESAVGSNAWYDQTIDTITGRELSNNKYNCGVQGYEAHHLVSFSIWDISPFGGIIPPSSGAWALHNNSGITFSTYGVYYSDENPEGITPPDSNCVWAGLQSRVRITCYSSWPEQINEDILMHYCLYVFFATSDAGAAYGRAIDNCGCTVFAQSLCAGMAVSNKVSGIGQIANTLTRNIERSVERIFPDENLCQRNAQRAESGASITSLIHEMLSSFSWQSTFESPSKAAKALAYALFQETISDNDLSHYADIVSSSGLASAADALLTDRHNSTSDMYPLSLPNLKIDINAFDAVGKTRSLQCAANSTTLVPRAYLYGDYAFRLFLDANGWSVNEGLSPIISIQDDAGGTYVDVPFTIVPVSYPEEAFPPITVTLIQDARQAQANGVAPDSTEITISFGEKFIANEQTPIPMPKKGCTTWTGWFTDINCTQPYTAHILTNDITLYCENIVTIHWGLTEDSALLESQANGNIWKDEDCSALTTLTEMLPPDIQAPWGSRYEFPGLNTIWAKVDGLVREIEGKTCHDPEGKISATSPIKISSNTTLYGNWACSPHDGVRVS